MARVTAAAAVLPEPTPHRLLRAVAECAVDLADLRDPQLVLGAIVRRTRELLGTDMAYLSLNDLDRGETHIEITDGVRTEAYRSIRMPLGTGILGAVAAGGSEVQTTDYLTDRDMTHLPAIDAIVRAEGVCSIHGCPVRAGGRVAAALLVAHRSPVHFSRRQITALRRMAELAAIALEPVRAGWDHSLLRSTDDLVEQIPYGPDAVCDVLTEHLGHPVRLYDVEGFARSAEVDASLHTGAPVAVPADDGRGGVETVLAIRHQEQHVATVLVPTDPGGLDAGSRLLLAHAVTAIGAAVVGQRRLNEAGRGAGVDVLAGLVDDESPSEETLARLIALGFTAQRPVTVLTTTAGLTGAGEGVATMLRRQGDLAVLASAHAGDPCLVVQTDDPAALAQRVHDRLGAGHSLVGWAVGPAGLADLGRAHRSAHRTLAALRSLNLEGACADPSRLGPAAMLITGVDADVVEATIRAGIGALLDHDEQRGTTLAETAWAVLDSGGNLRRAAEVLHVHPNTVRQRCERIAGLLGTGWRHAPGSLDVHFASRLWRVRHAIESA